MTRRKFTSKFKTKVVLEALKERSTTKEIAQRFEISVQQVNLWKREFLTDAETVFNKSGKSKKSEAELKEERLLKVIGQQKVELDFLKNALR
ncbi:transposase [Croceiramulus getboli]|nr:transposase [Flavobacteriaceae bacterium YJPT1-3]